MPGFQSGILVCARRVARTLCGNGGLGVIHDSSEGGFLETAAWLMRATRADLVQPLVLLLRVDAAHSAWCRRVRPCLLKLPDHV